MRAPQPRLHRRAGPASATESLDLRATAPTAGSSGQRLRGLQIDHQFELGGLLDGEVARFGALEDLVHEGSGAPVHLAYAGRVLHEAALLRPARRGVDGWNPVVRREIDDAPHLSSQHRILEDVHRRGPGAGHRLKRLVQLFRIGRRHQAELDLERLRRRVGLTEPLWRHGVGRVHKDGRTRERGHHFFQQLDALAIQLGAKTAWPVMLPPGNAKLATRPARTGSLSVVNTIGIVAVASFAARAAGAEAAKIRSTLEADEIIGKRAETLISLPGVPVLWNERGPFSLPDS